MHLLRYILPVLFWPQWLSVQAAPCATAIAHIAVEPETPYINSLAYIPGTGQDTVRNGSKRIAVKDTVQDAGTGEHVVGASVYAEASGAFSLELPAGEITLNSAYLGYGKVVERFPQRKAFRCACKWKRLPRNYRSWI